MRWLLNQGRRSHVTMRYFITTIVTLEDTVSADTRRQHDFNSASQAVECEHWVVRRDNFVLIVPAGFDHSMGMGSASRRYATRVVIDRPDRRRLWIVDT